MRFLSICVILVTGFVATGYCDSIQCYECENCGDLDDLQLVSCPLEVTTAQPTTPSSTLPSSESTDLPSSSTSEEPPSSSTSEAPVSSTQASESSTSSASESSSSSSSPSSSAAPSSTAPESPQSASLGGLSSSDYTSIVKTIRDKTRHARSYRSILKAAPTYACYSLDKIDGDNRNVKKGCVEVPEELSACEVLEAANGSIENCRSCDTDKCNSGVALSFSLMTFVLVALVALVNK